MSGSTKVIAKIRILIGKEYSMEKDVLARPFTAAVKLPL